MSSPGKFSGKGLVVNPLKIGKTGTRPMNPFAPSNSGFANELGGNLGASANRLNLMQGKAATGEDGEPTNGGDYYEGINVMGPSFYQDMMIILPTLFKVLRRRPEGVTHPFLRAIFQDIPVGQDTAGIIQRQMNMITAPPQVVGAHTGGPTFNFESTGATAFPIDLGYSHMMPTKALRLEQAQDIMALLIKTSVELFDEELDCMILGLCMSVICKPLEVITAEKSGAKISIDDLLGEFFESFGGLNKNGLNFFERVHDGVSERLMVVDREDPDWYIASNKHFSTQKLFSNANTFADAGAEGRENVKKGVQPMLSMAGNKFPCYPVKFNQTPSSSISVLEQYANIGSVSVQGDKTRFEGIRRFYHGSNSVQLVPVKQMWESVKANFFEANGTLMKLSHNLITKNSATILSACGNGDNDSTRLALLKSFDGCFFTIQNNTIVPHTTIGQISEKWLPTSLVARWYENNHKHAVTKLTGTSNFENEETSETSTTRDSQFEKLVKTTFTADKGKQDVLTLCSLESNAEEFLRDSGAALVLESVDKSDPEKEAREGFKKLITTPLEYLYPSFSSTFNWEGGWMDHASKMKEILGADRIAFLEKLASQVPENFTDMFFNDSYLRKKMDEILGYTDGVKYRLGKNQKPIKGDEGGDSHENHDDSGDHESDDKSDDESTNDDSGHQHSGNSHSGSSQSSGTVDNKRDAALNALKQKNPDLHKAVADFFKKKINSTVFDELVDNGENLPWKMVLWTPHIVYAGHAIIGVCTGPKTGYLGVSEVNTQIMPQNNFQTAIDLDMRVMFYVPGQEGIVRRDMTVITKIISRDLLSYLVITSAKENVAEDMILWKINPEQNEGHHFVTLDAWTNNLPERASYFGYYFTPKAFWDPSRIRNNDKFHHAFAPFVMQALTSMYYPTLVRQKQKSLFSAKTNMFGIIGLCVRESHWNVNGGEGKYEPHHGLWPSGQDWMNNDPRTGKRPAQTVAAMIHDGRNQIY